VIRKLGLSIDSKRKTSDRFDSAVWHRPDYIISVGKHIRYIEYIDSLCVVFTALYTKSKIVLTSDYSSFHQPYLCR